MVLNGFVQEDKHSRWTRRRGHGYVLRGPNHVHQSDGAVREMMASVHGITQPVSDHRNSIYDG